MSADGQIILSDATRPSGRAIVGDDERIAFAYAPRETSLGNLTRLIVQDLGASIVSGAFDETGSLPVEAEICRMYSASRSVVREAVKVLNAKGLLSARPRRGTQVRPRTDWNLLDPDILQWMLRLSPEPCLVEDLCRARRAFEPAAAAEAARTATGDQILSLHASLGLLRAEISREERTVEALVQFVANVLAVSNNPFIANMTPVSDAGIRILARLGGASIDMDRASLAAYETGVDAIVAGNQADAEAAFRDAVNAAIDAACVAGSPSAAADLMTT